MRRFLFATLISAAFSLGISGLAHAQTYVASPSNDAVALASTGPGGTVPAQLNGGAVVTVGCPVGCYQGEVLDLTAGYNAAVAYVAPSVSYAASYVPYAAPYVPYASVTPFYGSFFSPFVSACNFCGRFSRFNNGGFFPHQSGRFERNETEPVCHMGQHEVERTERCR